MRLRRRKHAAAARPTGAALESAPGRAVGCPTIPAARGRGPPPAGGNPLAPKLTEPPPIRPRATDIVLEVDDATRFTETFTHLRTGKPCRDRIGLLNGATRRGNSTSACAKMAEATTH